MPSALTLRHSISAATSRSVGTSTLSRSALRRLAEQSALVLEHARRRSADDERPEVVELRERRSVEGARRHAAGAERAQPRPQFGGGARGERERHDPRRIVRARRDAVGDAVGDGAGLAGAGAGEHADRADQRLGHHALVVVERGEQRRRMSRSRRRPRHATRGSGRRTSARGASARSTCRRAGRSRRAASASSSRVNQRSSRISTPSGAADDGAAPSATRAVNPSMRLAGSGHGCEPTYSTRSTSDAGLLADLADDRGLERLARLDESGEQREAVLLPERVRAEQHPVVVVGHEHDHRGVGAREERGCPPGRSAAPIPPAPRSSSTRIAGRTGRPRASWRARAPR